MATVQTTAGGIPVLILKEGTKENKGREAQKNNIADSQANRGNGEDLSGASWYG